MFSSINKNNFIGFCICKISIFTALILTLTIGFDLFYGLLQKTIGLEIRIRNTIVEPVFNIE